MSRAEVHHILRARSGGCGQRRLRQCTKARTYAARGDRKPALGALKAAIALGFSDANRLAEDPEWSRLRGDPEYLTFSQALSPRLALP